MNIIYLAFCLLEALFKKRQNERERQKKIEEASSSRGLVKRVPYGGSEILMKEAVW